MLTPEGDVALLLRCRVYDGDGGMYTLQHACLFRLVEPLHSRPSSAQSQLESSGRDRHKVTGRHLLRGAAEVQPQRPGAGGDAASGAGRALQAQSQGAGQGFLAWEGFVHMPGGGNKFMVRLDTSTGLYLALTNPGVDSLEAQPDTRNTLVLVRATRILCCRARCDLCACLTAARAVLAGHDRQSCIVGLESAMHPPLSWPSLVCTSNRCPRSLASAYQNGPVLSFFSPMQVSSSNLHDWQVAATVLEPNDGLSPEESVQHTGYMYTGKQEQGTGRTPAP